MSDQRTQTSVPSHSLVFSWAMISAPCSPSVSLEPVCSVCQWVLNSALNGFPPKLSVTVCSNASDQAASPPSTMTMPSLLSAANTVAFGPITATMPSATGTVCNRAGCAPRKRA